MTAQPINLYKWPQVIPMKTQINKMIIPCCKTFEFVKINDIVRCEGMQNYCRVFLISGDILTSTKTLGHFKMTLEAFGFLSCHRSHLVNREHITKYHKEGSVELVDQSTVPVSRRMKELFLNEVMNHFIC